MVRFFAISGWEFVQHLRSRGFLLWTFIFPVILAALILVPSLYYLNTTQNLQRTVGYVMSDSTGHFRSLSERLALNVETQGIGLPTQLVKVEADTSARMQQDYLTLAAIKIELDSLEESYIDIRERRRYIFQRPASRSREKLLNESYNQLITTREQKDLATIEYTRMKLKQDSLIHKAVLEQADSLLFKRSIDGYLVLDNDDFREGNITLHSLLPVSFLGVEDLLQSLQVLLVEERMRKDGLTVGKVDEYLQPINIVQMQADDAGKYKYRFLLNYALPFLTVLLLTIAIWSAGSLLFKAVASEKSNRVLEMMLGSITDSTYIATKVVGCGFLLLFQLLVWFNLIFFLILIKLIPVEMISYFTLWNAGVFVIYALLGYLLYAAIFLSLSSTSTSTEDRFSLQKIMRILTLLPLVLGLLVLQSPESVLVRFLSFIPLLTPVFMPLRIMLSAPPAIDIYITIGIMIIMLILLYLFAGKIFKATSLQYNKKAAWHSILRMIQVR
ncbi:MAG: ABC transporter permease [Calditrichia bacterium]